MENDLLHVIQKVRDLYLRYGIKSVSMDDVARELGISKKTLYLFVKDKTDLVKKVVESEIEEKRTCFNGDRYQNMNSLEQLFEVNRQITEMNHKYNPAAEYDLRKYYPDVFAMVSTARRENMLRHVLQNLVQGQSEGFYREDMDCEIVAKIHVARMESLFNSDIFSSTELASNKVYKEIFNYHLHGICNDEGLNFIKTHLSELKKENE